MNLVETSIKIRCDMPNCREIARYKLIRPGFVKNAGLFLCKTCMLDAYETIGKHIIPKSPDNMLNKKIVSKKSKGEINEKV
ncbi:MAG: hypothetical protein IJW59_01890 [Clostridia bacterium]|nr:hypothetical protein [Clostridia bacterium]